MRGILFSLLLLCSIALEASSARNEASSTTEMSISDLNVLLPYTNSRARVKYELKATNGCFKWTSNNPELIQVDSIYTDDGQGAQVSSINGRRERCSLSALLSVASGPGARASTFVNAEDLGMC